MKYPVYLSIMKEQSYVHYIKDGQDKVRKRHLTDRTRGSI